MLRQGASFSGANSTKPLSGMIETRLGNAHNGPGLLLQPSMYQRDGSVHGKQTEHLPEHLPTVSTHNSRGQAERPEPLGMKRCVHDGTMRARYARAHATEA